MLDQARMEAVEWKVGTATNGGCIRGATLHAHVEKNGQTWFEAQIALGTKPAAVQPLQHVIGVHIDPKDGVFLSIHQLDGMCSEQFPINAELIADLLHNKDPERQAVLTADQRTTKERHHRLADALVALCVRYHATLGVENISYRWQTDARPQLHFHE